MTGSANGSVRPVASGAALPGAGTSSAGIRLKGVGKRFGNVVALRGIDFEIERHSRIGIVGPSGGGKSTLLHIVSGLMEPDAGEVDVEGATSAKDRSGQVRHDAAA